MKKSLILLILILLASGYGFSQDIFLAKNGHVTFISDAPLEVIKASSENLEGAIKLSDRSFAFTIDNNTFKGFNSALQQEHFYENYMQVKKYPKSTFTGKIIEEIDLNKTEEQTVRAKGTLYIHGVEQERIIKGTLKVEGDKLLLQADFTVPLEDHDMKIPRIVYQKIAEIIKVSVSAEFNRINQ